MKQTDVCEQMRDQTTTTKQKNEIIMRDDDNKATELERGLRHASTRLMQ